MMAQWLSLCRPSVPHKQAVPSQKTKTNKKRAPAVCHERPFPDPLAAGGSILRAPRLATLRAPVGAAAVWGRQAPQKAQLLAAHQRGAPEEVVASPMTLARCSSREPRIKVPDLLFCSLF